MRCVAGDDALVVRRRRRQSACAMKSPPNAKTNSAGNGTRRGTPSQSTGQCQIPYQAAAAISAAETATQTASVSDRRFPMLTSRMSGV